MWYFNMLIIMKTTIFLCIITLFVSCNQTYKDGDICDMSISELQDKIKGGWAGQTIGCTYGGHTEFQYNGTIINDYVPIPWTQGCIKWWYNNAPDLYDDVYMDLTFVSVIDNLGLDAPIDSFAVKFANSPYPLWHANQAARYNILNGIMPPSSGYWKNNPHADDIDYQIEADFAGLMSPCMPNYASEISNKVGHIMNYGNGWYGGVFIGAMYSLAFVSDDVNELVNEALKTIPTQSTFYKCISDVIKWKKKYPTDWKATWFEVERKWTADMSCPDGVYKPMNIDAMVNSAYIVIGLLYGNGDFAKTIDIATRCGQDSDCNPASAAGILGVMIGYDAIPDYWKTNLKEVENTAFVYTNISLQDVYKMSLKHALWSIERNKGSITDDSVRIIYQTPQPVRYEQSFENLRPVERKKLSNMSLKDSTCSVVFNGIGFVLYSPNITCNDDNYIAEIEVYIDNKILETVSFPMNFTIRKHEMCWNYDLSKGNHTLTFVWKNPQKDIDCKLTEILIYDNI